jgi:hypothetical protein
VLVWAAADHEARGIRARARTGDLDLYPWWDQVWGQARTRALELAESLAPLLPGHDFLCEFKLPPELMVALPGGARADFRLKGRIDFLRVEEGEIAGDREHPDLSGFNCWVIDFKTGSSKPLTNKNILKGTGLQALLYALAVRALGASSTSMSVVAPHAEVKPQVELGPALNPILAALEAFHRDGIFGMRADANSEYGFAPEYPIATQFVPAHILAAKWELTHGMALEEDA